MSDKPICRIRYVDSSILYAQCEPHEIPKPTEITAVGFVADVTPDYITLALELHDDGDYRALVSIPRPAIREMRDLDVRGPFEPLTNEQQVMSCPVCGKLPGVDTQPDGTHLCARPWMPDKRVCPTCRQLCVIGLPHTCLAEAMA